MQILNQNKLRVKNIKRRGPFATLGLLLVALLLSLSVAACGTVSSTSATGSNAVATAEIATTTAAITNAATTSAATTSVANNPTVASPSPAATTRNISTTAPATTVSSSNQSGQSADQVESNTVVGVVQKISPAVVTIYNKGKGSTLTRRPGNTAPLPTPGADGTNDGLRTQGIGSGVIISDQGYILTNAHVVEGEQGLTVAFNEGKKVVSAKLVGADKTGDIAVLKIDGPVPAVAKFADSSKLQVGETVVAIGSALGDFRNSVTKGVISGVNRTVEGSTSVYVQTDAPINHGNSGGPLLNLRGEIVGINTLVVRDTPSAIGAGSDAAEGLGFAIPSNTVKVLSDQLISKGSVSRPYFGISYQMITPALVGSTVGNASVPAVEGAWVHGSRGSGIVTGGPADKAGLKDNDVITAVNGVALNDNNPLVNAVLNYKPGDVVKLTVQRGSQSLSLNLTLGERPQDLN